MKAASVPPTASVTSSSRGERRGLTSSVLMNQHMREAARINGGDRDVNAHEKKYDEENLETLLHER